MSEVVVSNSSPLIYLAKLNRLSLLRPLFGKVIIPREVYNEVVRRGKQQGYLETKAVERAIEEGWIMIREVKRDRKLRSFGELDIGEVEVLSLAKQLQASMVLIDDASARLVAESLGLNARGTIYVLLRASSAGAITKAEAKHLLTELISAGFWVSSEVLAKILDELG